MTVEEFKNTLPQERPPEDVSQLVKALWYDAKGNWNQAHELAQSVNNQDGSWVHAYLHRVEGDNANASYWYSRARKSMPQMDLQEEWEHIVSELLKA